ncbi:aryl-alcohol dehydrogenase-like predicted oxidoreductase [Sinorhizobium kostiense]|uniref:Aryl-alcohol dehydrogenase-like predicted oxidoreductase n=1 Tax=Sinorhizobium kostiense TaxID=76747 RepID=A0ABS4QWK6_9HYPH|nr:aldo/keto reductase [Sinorhizobium kostiense]MBP2234449.1 aryl-alcohol dehydrogenase-like predicted oxidoreductase [Sinorhizobium kostiense]
MSGEQLTREIGRSDVTASAVGLGTWAIGGWMWGGTDEAESVAAIQASLDAGVSLIDTAPAYGLGRSEEIVGKAIAGRRDKAVIATKCGLVWHTQEGNHFFDQDGKPVHRYLGRASIIHEVEQSLRRLGTDHIDLYITHWQDATTPIEETVAALEDLKRAGKIRAIGASNVNRSELEKYIKTGSLDAIQERYSMIDREIEADLLPLTVANGVSTLSYSSLALGLLSGTIGPDRVFSGDDQRKDNPRFSVANRQKARNFAEAIRPVAERHGASVAQTVIAWTLRQPGVTFALCGARNPSQALDNARAGTLRLSDEDLAAIETAVSVELANMDG